MKDENRKCHLCGSPTENKYCTNESCAEYLRDEAENIDAEFTDIIRERMDDKEFWKWVSGWLDEEFVCEMAEGWDTADKKELIDEYNKAHKK